MKSVLVPLAPGYEEIEAFAVVDILRRAGATVTLAGTVSGNIVGRCGVKAVPDKTLDEAIAAGDEFDMIVLPGGLAGTENLKKDPRIAELAKKMCSAKKFVAAICAAPTVLAAIGLTSGKNITSHPSVRDKLLAENVSDDRVVVDGNIITSQGPGTAVEFALKLVELLYGEDKAVEVNKGVLARI